MRILIVEDEALIAMMLADCLEGAGHRVVGPAATAAEALAYCEALVPDLAFLDIDLRHGGNGVVLARELVARWALPVVFASAQVEEARRARDIALGCIRKPYGAVTVLRSVEVARAAMDGGHPTTVPAGFELFRTAE
jgi:two-component system, response regulator PdtaR